MRGWVVCLVAVSTVSQFACQRGKKAHEKAPTAAPVEKLPDRLLAEFQNAYPKQAPKSNGERSFDLVAAPAEVQQFDGRPLRVWAYNGKVPGPVLRVRLGQALKLTLRNDLPQPTTIHWHGVRVPNAMDGVPGVTQDPIEPGEIFEYRFVPKDAGTFWFHPHVRTSEQVERGLYGVLVVEDAKPLPYTREEVWVLDDWRLGPDGQVDPRFVTRHDLAHDGRWGQMITVNGQTSQELVVRAGERLRLRLVNPSNGRAYLPDFSELDAKVIAVDGMYTASPLDPSDFVLAPGNRIDLDITVSPASKGRTFRILDRFLRRPSELATIRVTEQTVPTPSFAPPSNPNIPGWREALDAPVDTTYVLDVRRGGPRGIEWTINDRVWGHHEVTALRADRFTRVRFQNESFRLHPMHVHGQFFKVLARNGKPVDEPYFRDTVLLRRKESVDVGMVPLDWGKWMMHCHILEHAESGMMTLIDVDGGAKD